jgi:hypothetical protein
LKKGLLEKSVNASVISPPASLDTSTWPIASSHDWQRNRTVPRLSSGALVSMIGVSPMALVNEGEALLSGPPFSGSNRGLQGPIPPLGKLGKACRLFADLKPHFAEDVFQCRNDAGNTRQLFALQFPSIQALA